MMSHEPIRHPDDSCEEHCCPVCGDDSAQLLSPVEANKLILAATYGQRQADDEAISRMLNAGINVRLRTRTLELALEGRVVPVEILAGEVYWRPFEQCFTADEAAQYRMDFEQVAGDSSDSFCDDSLTAAERERLTMAAVSVDAGLGCYERAETVIQWARTVRAAEQDLQAILAGQLMPVILAEVEGKFWLQEVGELPECQRVRYQRALADLDARGGQFTHMPD